MSETRCLGYLCICGTRIAVYRFTLNGNGWKTEQKIIDSPVLCPKCEAAALIPVAQIQNLQRWTESSD